MDNKTKQAISSLESRIMRLENVINNIANGITEGNNYNPICGMCGCNPMYIDEGTCANKDCSHGLGLE